MIRRNASETNGGTSCCFSACTSTVFLLSVSARLSDRFFSSSFLCSLKRLWRATCAFSPGKSDFSTEVPRPPWRRFPEKGMPWKRVALKKGKCNKYTTTCQQVKKVWMGNWAATVACKFNCCNLHGPPWSHLWLLHFFWSRKASKKGCLAKALWKGYHKII